MNKEQDLQSKRKRQLSKRAQLRRQQKCMDHQKLMICELIHERHKLIDQNKELYRRLCETQKLLPFWVRKVL